MKISGTVHEPTAKKIAAVLIEMGAALLRRVFPPLFMGVCAHGRSLLGAQRGDSIRPRLLSGSQAAIPACSRCFGPPLPRPLDIRAAFC